MRRLLFALIVLLAGCAQHKPPAMSPASDPVRVADGLRVPSPPPTATLRVRLAADAPPVTFVVPANVPHAIAWCDFTGTWNKARWYLIRKNGLDLDWTGAVIQDSTNPDPRCVQTATAYAFAPGSYNVEVHMVNHCEINDPDPMCHQSVGMPCDPATGCTLTGDPTNVTVLTSQSTMTGPPPAVVNGTVIR